MQWNRTCNCLSVIISEEVRINMRRIDKIIIHCSATAPNANVGAVAIDAMHKARGWRGIGYHKVIRRDGSIEDGRSLEKAGAHARGHNAYSVGICLEGGVKSDGKTPDFNYTRKQLHTLYGLLFELIGKYPGCDILGHRDLPGVTKACPCFDVQAWLNKKEA